MKVMCSKSCVSAVVLLLAFVPAGCGETETAPPAAETSATAEVVWPKADIAQFYNADIEARVEALLAQMTVEEKVGQIIQPDSVSVTPQDVKQYHLGSILSGGNSAPGGKPYATAAEWVAAADAYYDASLDASDGGVVIPVIWGIDAVHGHNNVIGGTIFPHNVALGAANDPDLIRDIAAITAKELRVTGHDWTFAPTLAVPRDNRWGRAYEGFGETPDIASRYAGPIVEGLQGVYGTDGFMGAGQVISTAKHFIADGGTDGGRDQGDAKITETELRDIHGVPYIGAINAGVQAIMASFSSWNGVKIHGDAVVLNGILKQKIGFDGFVVGDWNAHGQVDGCTNESCPQAVNAGLDMFMAPDSWRGLYENTLAQAKTGEISAARLDDAVRRILRVKLRVGMFDQVRPSARPFAGDESLLGSPAHRAVARRAVRESLVLLKNQEALLPLKPAQRVLVIGPAADSVSYQSGGWTLTWQGGGLDNSLFPKADTILSGIRQAVEDTGGTVEYSPDGSYSETPDVVIAVYGEKPYAEFQGDVETLYFGDDQTLETLRKMKADGIKTVSLFLSGRPMWVNPFINASDAFVAAWWPGSEGAGIADVIFAGADGAPQYDFNGKLSFSWPKRPDQTPLNVGDEGYDPLFAYGYGLTYQNTVTVPELSEDLGTAQASSNKYLFFTKGRAQAPWQLVAGAGQGLNADAGGNSPVIKAVDRDAQEDAISIRQDTDEASFVAFTADNPIDLFREANGMMELALAYRVDSAPAGKVSVAIACDAGPYCGAALDITDRLAKAPLGQWQSMRLSLLCFGRAGADLAQVTAPFILQAEGGFQVSLSDVQLLEDADGMENCIP